MLTLVGGPYDIVDRLNRPLSVRQTMTWDDDRGCLVAVAEIATQPSLGESYNLGMYYIQLDGKAAYFSSDVVSGLGYLSDGRVAAGGTYGTGPIHIPTMKDWPVLIPGVMSSIFGMTKTKILFAYARWARRKDYDNNETEAMVSFDNIGVTDSMLLPYDIDGADQVSKWWFVQTVDPDHDTNTGAWSYGPTRIEMYDGVNHVRVPNIKTSIGMPFKGIAYSRKHDMFFVVRRHQSYPYQPYPDDSLDICQLYVYANQPAPYRLTQPVLSGYPRLGGRVIVTSQLLGDTDEPCANRAVSFSATGGTVEHTPVLTDKNGTAVTVIRVNNSIGTLNVTATFEN